MYRVVVLRYKSQARENSRGTNSQMISTSQTINPDKLSRTVNNNNKSQNAALHVFDSYKRNRFKTVETIHISFSYDCFIFIPDGLQSVDSGVKKEMNLLIIEE